MINYSFVKSIRISSWSPKIITIYSALIELRLGVDYIMLIYL